MQRFVTFSLLPFFLDKQVFAPPSTVQSLHFDVLEVLVPLVALYLSWTSMTKLSAQPSTLFSLLFKRYCWSTINKFQRNIDQNPVDSILLLRVNLMTPKMYCSSKHLSICSLFCRFCGRIVEFPSISKKVVRTQLCIDTLVSMQRSVSQVPIFQVSE